MRTLTRSLRSGRIEGRPLPTVFPSLERAGAHFNRGEVVMIAGQSGAGKSRIAQWIVKDWAVKHNLTGLYFSADGRQLEVASRFAAMLDGTFSVHEMKERLINNDAAVQEMLQQVAGVEWCFDGEISLDLLDLELTAFAEKWGKWPDFIVVDNTIDIEEEHEDEWHALRKGMKRLAQVAGDTDACVIALHHTSEGVPENPCPPKKALMGKISAKPTLILTTAEVRNGTQPVAIVKGRESDRVDKSGSDAIFLRCKPETNSFEDH